MTQQLGIPLSITEKTNTKWWECTISISRNFNFIFLEINLSSYKVVKISDFGLLLLISLFICFSNFWECFFALSFTLNFIVSLLFSIVTFFLGGLGMLFESRTFFVRRFRLCRNWFGFWCWSCRLRIEVVIITLYLSLLRLAPRLGVLFFFPFAIWSFMKWKM